MLKECLEGVRVIDLSQYVPGPFASLVLSDLGAEVVKVEPPHGDPMRTLGPCGEDGISAFYKQLNRNKTVVRLDLKTAADKAVFADLVRKADVVLESFRPGAMERLGFGHETLRRLNPGIVHCALSGYGQTGPYAQRAGHDVNYLAVAGMLAETGPAERPLMPYPPMADHLSALHAVCAILGALFRTARNGKGAFLDVSIYESAMHLGYMGLALARRGLLGREMDGLNGGAAFYAVYRCEDGRFASLGAIEPKFWSNFCTAAGRPEWAVRQNEPLPQRDLGRDVAALFTSRPLAHWVELLAQVDCCFEPVLTPDEAAGREHALARGLVGTNQADGEADINFPAFFDGAPPAHRRAHNEDTATAVAEAWSAR